MLGLTLISVFLGALGQVMIKIGAQHLELNFSGVKFSHNLLALMKNTPLLAGVALYVLSFILWVKVLSKVELSYAYPLVSLGYVVVMLFAYFYFKEQISPYRAFGVLLIVMGVFFVARS